MAPGPKDACGSCSAGFHHRQKVIACCVCSIYFHCKCVDIVNEDYDLLMEEGVSRYKCSKCTRRTSQEGGELTPQTTPRHAAPGTEKDWNATPPPETKKDIQTVLEELVDNFARLKAENASLRQEVHRLNETVSLFVKQHASQTSDDAGTSNLPSYASTAAAFPPLHSQHQRLQMHREAPRGNASVGTTGRSGPLPPVSTEHQEAVRRKNMDEDGFTRVTYRKPVKPSVGTSKTSKISAIPPAPQKSALFVSRLSPETTTKDVEDLVAPVLQGKSFTCTKLKTRLPYYASFHVLVDKDAFEAVNSVSVWPEGSIFRQFFGPLPSSRRFGSEDRNVVSGAVGGTQTNLTT